MNEDRIEREILIAAAPERVWAVLTEADHLGEWLGGSRAVEIDLRPGGSLLLDHGAHGPLLARFESVDRPRRLSYRWSQGAAGEEPDEHNSTLVEFRLTPEAGRTRLRIVETGFSTLSLPGEVRRDRHRQNSAGWTQSLTALQRLSERLPA